MSLAGRILSRLTGRPERSPTIYGPMPVLEELPYLREQVRAYASATPVRVTGPGIFDNFTGETAEMRVAYRRAFTAEPAVKAALLGKIAAVQALGLNVKPADDTPLDQYAADFVKRSLTTVGPEMGLSGIPLIVWEVLAGGLMDGFSVSEKIWKKEERGKFKGKIGLGDLKSKDSRFIQFELDQFRNISSVISMRGNSGERFPPSDFVLFNYLSFFRNPFGTSDLRASYRAASMIPSILNLRMILLDKYTGPFIHAKVTDPALVERMKSQLAFARAGGFIVTDPADDLTMLDLAMKGTTDFQAALEDLRKEIAIGISGAFLTMMTGEGGSGTRGDSSVQQDTVDLFIWLLAVAVQGAINRQIVPDLIVPNFGDTIDFPTVTLEAPNPDKVLAELGIDETLDRLGVPLSLGDLYERSGRRAPKDAADTVTKPTGGGLPGMGGLGQPGGDNPFDGLDNVFGDGPAGDEPVENQDDEDKPAQFDEPRFTGTITDSAGRKRTYRDGKPVKGTGDTDSPSPKGGGDKPASDAAPKPPGHEHAPTADEVTREVTAGLSPAATAKPGVVERIAQFVAKIYVNPKVFNVAVKIGMLAHEFAPDILDTAEDYENPAKAKTSTGQPVGSATGNDPIFANTGLPGYVALTVAAKAIGVIAGHIASKRASTHAEGDDPVDLVLELIAALREISGNTAPLPSREEVAAKLAEKAAARGAD